MTIVYIASHSPTDAERSAAPDGASFRNASLWTGYVEPADRVYAASETIRAAYEDAGIEARPIGGGDSGDVEGEVEDYHIGAGWYEIDGEKVRGKEAARELLND